MTEPLPDGHLALQNRSGEAALYRLAELATAFGAQHIASTARSVAERVSEGRFYVACVGQFKRGKSTLLNALIGHSILPTGVVPVTSIPTVIRYGECPAARVRLKYAAWTDISINDVGAYVSEAHNPENSKGVAAVEIFVPSALLGTGMCLVDTPGLGSVFAGNTAATHAFIPHIDAAIVVIGADPPLSGDELQLVEAVSQDVDELVFVLNKADRANPEERAAALEFARGVLETRVKQSPSTIFEISALERLNHKGPERDWPLLIRALDDLMTRSGHALVRKSAERAVRRATKQLLSVIAEERNALDRPLEESERRIARLRKTVGESTAAMRDLGGLLGAEQHRLSAVFVDRKNVFLKQAQANAHTELTNRLSSTARIHNGPAYRRSLNHVAQEIARAELVPWLKGEAEFAEEEFRKTAKRFVELANEFLHCLAEADVPGLEELPEDLSCDQGLSVRSEFHFHLIERVAAPASPFLLISDFLLGSLGFRSGIVRGSQEFLDQLLEVNSSRVQSDVDERVRESRKKLEAEIKIVLGEATAVADRALARARAVQAAGIPELDSTLARLNSAELELRKSISLLSEL